MLLQGMMFINLLASLLEADGQLLRNWVSEAENSLTIKFSISTIFIITITFNAHP